MRSDSIHWVKSKLDSYKKKKLNSNYTYYNPKYAYKYTRRHENVSYKVPSKLINTHTNMKTSKS